MEFWNSSITEESWNKLIEMRKEIDFVLIGGWAIYMYTKMHKSKDIDIIVDYQVFRKLSSVNVVQKNERLHKYEIKSGRFDIDIYLPKYSRLSLPAEDILEHLNRKVEGFMLPVPEALMILKLGAAADRRNSVKGEKDCVDVLSLLFFSDFDPKRFRGMLETYGNVEYARLLLDILKNADKHLIRYLNLNEKSFSVLRRENESGLLKIL